MRQIDKKDRLLKPFFSIVIPTHNRFKELKRALKSVLKQSFANFEVVITDNSNKAMCRSDFGYDRRIRYTKNKTNIGFTRNLYKAIGLTKGEYIFVLGDDDWLGNANLLENVYQKIKEKHYGFIRVSFQYCDQKNRKFSLYLDQKTNRILDKNENSLKILDFLDKSKYYSVSGLIFKHPENLLIKPISQSNDPQLEMSDFWVKYLFNAVKEAGGWIDFEDVIYLSWSQYQSPTFYYLVNNRLPKEAVLELLKPDLTKEEMDSWIKKETVMFSRMLPSIKHYSSRTNLIVFVKRLIILNQSLKWQLHLYLGLIIALIMPKWLWIFLRSQYIKTRLFKEAKDVNNKYNNQQT